MPYFIIPWDFKHNPAIETLSIHVNVTLELIPRDLVDGAVRHQAISWASVNQDFPHNLTSLSYNEFLHNLLNDVTASQTFGRTDSDFSSALYVRWPVNYTSSNNDGPRLDPVQQLLWVLQ